MSSAVAVARAPQRPLHRLVAVVLTLGAGAAVALGCAVHAHPATPPLWPTVLPQRVLLVGLFLALACIAEIAYVRVRHGDSTEDLTFFEAVLVGGALVLPPMATFAVSLGGLLLACALMRRPPVKTLFNLGSYAIATAAFVATSMLPVASRGPFTLPVVAALLLGTGLFAGVNLLALAQVLLVTEGLPRRELLRQEWQLSALMTFSQVGLGAVTVAVARHTPALLPFTVLPALACGYAYRAAADRAGGIERARTLAALGAVLAAGQRKEDDLLPDVLDVLCRLFGSDDALVLGCDGRVLWHTRSAASARGALTVQADRPRLNAAPSTQPRRLAPDELPPSWRQGIAVSADLGERGEGVLVLGWTHTTASRGSRPWPRRVARLATVDEGLLGTVTAAAATSLRARQHLTGLVEESAKLQTIVEHSSDGIVVLDRDGQLLVWSPTMARLTGVDAGTASTLTVATEADLWPHAARATTVDPVQTLLAGVAAVAGSRPPALSSDLDPAQPHTEAQLTLGSDTETARLLDVAITRTHDPSGEWRLAILTVHDVTRERRLDRLKSDFVATVSHELRTPLTPIKGYARMLATKGDAVEPARRLKALRLIEERADHLARLVDDLLLASRVSTGTATFVVETTRHDLDDLVSRAVDGFPHLAGRLTVRRSGQPLPVDVDPIRVVQCLSNLLSNAEKYSPPQSPITVTVEPPTAGGTTCTVTVTDAGRGIAPADLDNVFQRFYRVEDAYTMRTGGSGLGLFIARELARAMHGDITADSVLHAGSRFHLTLPLRAAPTSRAA